MDPNGFEVGDKCETGPQAGTPLGFAANGSPYNQVIAGHEYLLQTMWSNADSGCRQRSASTSSALPLPAVRLDQCSPVVSGYERDRAQGRAGARGGGAGGGRSSRAAATSTRADGSWRLDPALARRPTAPAGVGDDREEVLVHYGSQGPGPELIQTGNGGNPFGAVGLDGLV